MCFLISNFLLWCHAKGVILHATIQKLLPDFFAYLSVQNIFYFFNILKNL